MISSAGGKHVTTVTDLCIVHGQLYKYKTQVVDAFGTVLQTRRTPAHIRAAEEAQNHHDTAVAFLRMGMFEPW